MELPSLLLLGKTNSLRLKVSPANLDVVLSAEKLRNIIMACAVAGLATPVGQCWIENTNKHIGSGQSKGYGFVGMPSRAEGQAAITSLNGKSLRRDRTIDVIQALRFSKNRANGFYDNNGDG